MTLPLKDLLRHLWHLLGGMALPVVYLYWADGPVPMVAGALAIGALGLGTSHRWHWGNGKSVLEGHLPPSGVLYIRS